jgi:RHS repeat-associated protein
MTALHDLDDRVFTYAFDGDGNRIGQSLNDCLETRFVYDGPNVVLDLNSSNDVVYAYVNGPGIDRPIERLGFIHAETRMRHVYHADALGSVIVMTDETGTEVKNYSYDAFGQIREDAGYLLINRVTYTARESVGDSLGLYYYRNRVVDPNCGRFTTPDPIHFDDGPNVYIYVGNQPTSKGDAMGLLSSRQPGKDPFGGTDKSMGKILGAACAKQHCDRFRSGTAGNKYQPRDLNAAWADCKNLQEDRNLPTGGSFSESIVSECAAECERLTSDPDFIKTCCEGRK